MRALALDRGVWWLDVVALLVAGIVFVVPFLFILVTAAKDRAEASRLEFTPADRLAAAREPRARSSARGTT